MGAGDASGSGVPAWVLGLVPLLLIVGGDRRCSPRSTRPGWASGAGRRPRSWRSSGRCSRPA